MYRLDKFILHQVRYLVWSGAVAELPEAAGVALLLSGKDGVGADRLVVLGAGHPWGVRCFGVDGEACAAEALDRRVAALACERDEAGLNDVATGDDVSVEYSEVRLTEAFFQRLMKCGCAAKIAG